MAIHVGHEVARRLEESGMSKRAFAAAISRSYQNLYKLLEDASWDTQVLMATSRALNFNFFRLLADELEVGSPQQVSEPAAPYITKREGVDITIHVDPMDEESTNKLIQALQLVKAAEHSHS